MNVPRSATAIGSLVALLGGTAVFLVAWLMVPTGATAGPVVESAAQSTAEPVPGIAESPWEVPLVTGAAVLTGLLACLVPLAVLRRTAVPVPAAEVVPPATPPPPDPRFVQREKAVRGLADLIGQLPPEFAWQAVNVLEAAGARQIVADGRPFDPGLHHAVGTEATPEASLHDTVARTVRPGWADRDRVVTPARVVVYVAPAQSGALP
jgi:hypothetical protein